MRAVTVLVFAAFFAFLATCSAENGGGGSGGVGPSHNSNSQGGSSGGGQQAGVSGQTAGFGGYSAIGGGAAEDTSGGTGGDICADQQVAVERSPANVVLVVDRSSSMVLNQFGNANRWDALYDALMANPDGVVYPLQGAIRFAFYSYTNYPTEGIPCPDLRPRVFPPEFNNYDNIAAQYSRSTPPMGGPMPNAAILMPVGETPTGEALAIVLDEVLPWVAQGSGPDAEPLGPTILLLATDGEPDSCADIAQDTEGRNDVGRQMVIDQIVRAFQGGVQTYVLSVGNDVGDQHLQDVANAGVGVAPGTNAPFWKADNPQALEEALAAILGEVLSCVVELNGEITNAEGACELGTVNLNGVPLVCNDPNGWRVADATHIELLGTACDQFKLSPTTVLEASFPCDVIIVE